jgi:hypothetical protein
MIKCSFCEQPLVCKHCRTPFRPRSGSAHVGVFQPDMEVDCPACQKVLVCQLCGFAYGEPDEETPAAE